MKGQEMLIGITGKAGSGKDTFAKYFIEQRKFHRYAFAGPIKRMVEAGFELDPGVWDDREAKEAVIPWLGRSPRYLAQTLGTEWGRELVRSDVWLAIADQQLVKHDRLIITDVRFDNEAEWIRYNGGRVINVVRDEQGVDNAAHISENGVDPKFITQTVRNVGTIEDLYTKARAAWNVWNVLNG